MKSRCPCTVVHMSLAFESKPICSQQKKIARNGAKSPHFAVYFIIILSIFRWWRVKWANSGRGDTGDQRWRNVLKSDTAYIVFFVDIAS